MPAQPMSRARFAGYIKPSNSYMNTMQRALDRAGARVDQRQARRRADQEAMVAKPPRIGGEFVRIPRREGI